MICCITCIIAVIPILCLKCYNDDSNKIQRYLYNNNRQAYLLFELSFFILTLAFLMNIRVITSYVATQFIDYFGLKAIFFSFFPSLKTLLDKS